MLIIQMMYGEMLRSMCPYGCRGWQGGEEVQTCATHAEMAQHLLSSHFHQLQLGCPPWLAWAQDLPGRQGTLRLLFGRGCMVHRPKEAEEVGDDVSEHAPNALALDFHDQPLFGLRDFHFSVDAETGLAYIRQG